MVLATDAVAALHAAVVLFLLMGGLLGLRRPRLLRLHVPVSLAVLAVNLAGADCPLTDLELWLRARTGGAAYTGGFLGHYALQPLGVDRASATAQVGIYTVALLPNVVAYTLLVGRRGARGRVPASTGA